MCVVVVVVVCVCGGGGEGQYWSKGFHTIADLCWRSTISTYAPVLLRRRGKPPGTALPSSVGTIVNTRTR